MARVRSPARDEAFEIYKKHNGNIDLVVIAEKLSISAGTVRGWKAKDKWNEKLNGALQKNTERSDKKLNKKSSKNDSLGDFYNDNDKSSKTNSTRVGAPLGNKNSVGNKGGKGGPKRNKKAETHGFFSKYLPDDTLDLINEIEIKNPIDILWENITIQYAAIIRSQRIMFVESKEEMIKELRKSKVKTKTRETEKTNTNENEEEYEYEFQFAWDRQATFLTAQSRAISELRSSIKQYEEMLQSDLATEEQKLRIAKLKGEVNRLDNPDKDKPIEILIKRKERD